MPGDGEASGGGPGRGGGGGGGKTAGELDEAPIPSRKLTKGGYNDDDNGFLPLKNNNQPTMVCRVDAAYDGEPGGKGGEVGGGRQQGGGGGVTETDTTMTMMSPC